MDVNRQEVSVEGRFDSKAIHALNGLPKFEGSRKPWDNVHFVEGHGGWWAECPTTGRGFLYSDLVTAVRSWDVVITHAQGQALVARPA